MTLDSVMIWCFVHLTSVNTVTTVLVWNMVYLCPYLERMIFLSNWTTISFFPLGWNRKTPPELCKNTSSILSSQSSREGLLKRSIRGAIENFSLHVTWVDFSISEFWIPKKIPTDSWNIPHLPPKYFNWTDFRIINRWLRVWGMSLGYGGVFSESCIYIYKYIYSYVSSYEPLLYIYI